MMGRPTDYRPEYCQALIDFCSTGKSLTAFAVKIGVHRDTLYQWGKVHQDFSDALTRARQAAQVHWESFLESNLGNREVNAKLVEFLMASRFDDYRPQTAKMEVQISGNVHVRSLPRAELEKLAAQVIDIEEVEPAQIEPKSGENSPDAST